MTYLVEESQSVVAGKKFAYSLEAEVEFLEGSWAQYSAGESVTVTYTQEGLASLVSQYKTRPELTQDLTHLMRQHFGPDAKVAIELVDLPNETIMIREKKMQCQWDGAIKWKSIIRP